MRVPKPLIYGALGVMAFGVGYDVASIAGLMPSDGQDHTVPVAAVPASGLVTGSVTTVAPFVSNYVTGDVYRVAPTDRTAMVSPGELRRLLDLPLGASYGITRLSRTGEPMERFFPRNPQKTS